MFKNKKKLNNILKGIRKTKYKTSNKEADRAKMDPKDTEKGESVKPDKASNEDKTLKKKTFEELIKDIRKNSELLKDKEIFDSEGNFLPALEDCVSAVIECEYISPERPQTERNECQKILANILIESNLLDYCCNIVIYNNQNKWFDEGDNARSSQYNLFELSLSTIWEFSDSSDEIAVALANRSDFLETIRHILSDISKCHLKNTLELTKRNFILIAALSVVHNLSMRDSNIGKLRALDITEVLKQYLFNPFDDNRLLALASLAAIVNEEESEIINANPGQVKLLFEILQKALGVKERHRYDGWSCKEIALIIRNLARNDANKCLLVEHGALELLVELAKTGDQEEQYESTHAIWALTFDKKNQKKIANSHDLGVIELLLELKANGDDEIKRVCNGALWNLEEDMKASTVAKYKKLAAMTRTIREWRKIKEKAIEKSSEEVLEDGGHVMISYQWDDQETLLKVRDGLKNAGLKVWMDIDQMSGSTIQAMAEAVENASLVLVCYSRKYKNSSNCRAEAEYAYQNQKKIIPLKLERDYKPDGWLGFIVGAKLFFEFTDKKQFEQKFKHLVREIQIQRCNVKEEVVPEKAPPVCQTDATALDEVDNTRSYHSNQTMSMTTSKEILQKLRAWNANDMQTWINTNDLKSSVAGTWTGREVALLLKMSSEAPESFYRFLETHMDSDLHAISKVVWALEHLKDGN